MKTSLKNRRVTMAMLNKIEGPRVKKEYWSDGEAMVLAAMLTYSNMGWTLTIDEAYSAASELHPEHYRHWIHVTIEDCVVAVMGRFIESDHDEEAFYEEAKTWVRRLKREGKANTEKYWPQIVSLYREACLWMTLGACPSRSNRY